MILSSLQRQNSEMDSGGPEPETQALGCLVGGLGEEREAEEAGTLKSLMLCTTTPKYTFSMVG